MNRKDQAFKEAREATLPTLDTPDKIVHAAMESDIPSENMDWKPPETLETPPPPPGWRYTWVRTIAGKFEDGDNVRKMFGQGWRPVTKGEVPAKYFMPTISDARFNDGRETIGVRDMILCKIPERMWNQRMAYYNRRAGVQISEIDKRLHSESQRSGDRFFADRKTEVLRAPPTDSDPDD